MDRVCICLATFNGEKFLEKQLQSLSSQTHKNWSLIIGDDGSTDSTIPIITKYIADNKDKKILLLRENRQGFVKNFLSIVCHKKASGDFFAFVDQDDIWLPTKLETAVKKLGQIGGNAAKLYCGRTTIIDPHDNICGHSPLFIKTPSFRNALVQSIAGGNTMVFNLEAKKIITALGPNITVASHDWWMYIIITGMGGKIIYDPVPQVLYRSHDKNLVGVNQGFLAKSKRIIAVFMGRFKRWNSMHIKELGKRFDMLQPENQIVLQRYISLQQSWGIGSIRKIQSTGLYRQTKLGTMSLYLASFFGKM